MASLLESVVATGNGSPNHRSFTVAVVAACPFPAPRGTPIRILRLSEALAARGHRVHVVAYDAGQGTVAGHHVELRDGAPVRLRPWQLHFRSPDELDQLATAAGLRLDERFGGWDGEPFDDASAIHVSVYRAAGGPSLVSDR